LLVFVGSAERHQMGLAGLKGEDDYGTQALSPLDAGQRSRDGNVVQDVAGHRGVPVCVGSPLASQLGSGTG